MSKKNALAPLVEALGAVIAWLDSQKVPCAIVGGVAASIHGSPRATKDLDLVALAEENSWALLVREASPFSIVSRQARALDFARVSRVLLMRHEPSGIDIDLSLAPYPSSET
jgi:hypothetical protein